MKTIMERAVSGSECPVKNNEPAWALRITPGLEFNVRAVRARAGLLNLLISTAIVLMLMKPESNVVTYILGLLTFDLAASVFFGLTPYSPLGIAATELTRRHTPQGTPHLPKRFAWSMGTALAASCLAMNLSGVSVVWIYPVLGVFHVLTWLDAVLGFCMGCWIYSKLFGCSTCHMG